MNDQDAQISIDKLKDTYETYKQMIEHSFEGIAITDAAGMITYLNPSYEKHTGLKANEYIGCYHHDLIDKEVIDQSGELKVLQTCKAQAVVQKVFTGRTVLVSAIPIKDYYGKLKKVISSIMDLTRLNQLEQEIVNLERKNEEVSKQLEEIKNKQATLSSIVAYDAKMKSVVERALRVAQLDSVVLIQGESGVGKEVIVKLIHENSNRSDEPFIKVNCGAIPNELLESELFGYEPGAFTGAHKDGKIGLFEQAAGGTILLDEIGDMPLHLQVKLLRALQEFEMTRVGGVTPIKIKARVIAATNQRLADSVKDGEFREDLFYRLNIIPIHVPPLRERQNDIVPLTYHFINELREKYGVNKIFSKEALQLLQNYHWPGNVRELQNIVERLCMMVMEPIVNEEDIKKEVGIYLDGERAESNRQVQAETVQPILANEQSLKKLVEHYEKGVIREALEKYPSIRSAAKGLKVDPSTLSRKVQRYFN